MVNILIYNVFQKEEENDMEPKGAPKTLMSSRRQQNQEGEKSKGKPKSDQATCMWG
jgi:hypothetical protein